MNRSATPLPSGSRTNAGLDSIPDQWFTLIAVVDDATMGSVGDAYDNALCESFFATLECELLDRRRFATPTQAHIAVFDFIEGWYNPHRRHSALDYESPLSYEIKHRPPAT
jgi:transposase InsO family protein